jgi:hypothetical protein
MRIKTIIACILAAVFMFVFTRQSMAWDNSLQMNLGEVFNCVELLKMEPAYYGGIYLGKEKGHGTI